MTLKRWHRWFITLLILLGVLCITLSLYYRWRLYKVFKHNFAMSYFSVQDFQGEENSWLAYGAWIRFTSKTPVQLKHPEDYRSVPCSQYLINELGPFSELEDYVCFEGRTNFWTRPDGTATYEQSAMIYMKKAGKVLFRIN